MAQAESYLQAMGTIKQLLQGPVYDRARNHRRRASSQLQIPSSFEKFEAITSFRSWQRRIVQNSVVKGVTRALYCSPEDFEPAIAVAQTHDDASGSLTTPVRETEVIIKRQDGTETFDFFVYDEEGDLSRTSAFFNSRQRETVGPAPHTCMSCHYDGNQGVFQNRPLTFGGLRYPERLTLPACFQPQNN